MFGLKKKPQGDPEPGIGGYEYPRGPAGATGYDGSTSAVRENPPAAESRLHDNYSGRNPRRRFQTIAYQQSRFDGENWHLPVNPDTVRATENRNHTAVSGGLPGNQNQRNEVYRGGRQAMPGTSHSYHAAPNASEGKQRGFLTTQSVTQVSRYKFGGADGGLDLYQDTLSERQMPFTGQGGYRGNLGHARGGVRGAVNDGTRFTTDPLAQFFQQGGAYGSTTRGHQRHRPTVFREPAPWASRFYDTTQQTGTPDNRATNSHMVDSVHVSPQVSARRNRGFLWLNHPVADIPRSDSSPRSWGRFPYGSSWWPRAPRCCGMRAGTAGACSAVYSAQRLRPRTPRERARPRAPVPAWARMRMTIQEPARHRRRFPEPGSLHRNRGLRASP